VVLEHPLDGEDLAWVRDHLRRCDACRERIDVFRERLLRVEEPAARLGAVRTRPGHIASLRRRASASWGRIPLSRRYATVALLVAALAGVFVSGSPLFAADAAKGTHVSSTLLDTGSAASTKPSLVPSASATPEANALPATSQAGTVPTMVVPSARPTPTHAPSQTPAPVSYPPPTVHLSVSTYSGLAPLSVTADATGSNAARGIASYAFDFGDGTVIHALGSTTASHIYCQPGHYQLKVIVTDAAGVSSIGFVFVDVTAQVPPVSC
jgi:PKD domain